MYGIGYVAFQVVNLSQTVNSCLVLSLFQKLEGTIKALGPLPTVDKPTQE